MTYSLIIPVYKSQDTLTELLVALHSLSRSLKGSLEVVFVVDGSPDQSADLLQLKLPQQEFSSQLIVLSRNFGSFYAIRAGLQKATGDFFAIMADDLQEPPELIVKFFTLLESKDYDVVVGARINREDSWSVCVASNLFWSFYRKFIIPELPKGGVDVFGCNLNFRNCLLQCEEAHTSLISLIYWLGFRRTQVEYSRRKRCYGRSTWTLRKKINYLMDSIFAFTDLPIKCILYLGILGVSVSLMLTCVVLLAHFLNDTTIPGYTATVLMILFFGGINMFALGLVGTYTWRGYENTKKRPLTNVLREHQFKGLTQKKNLKLC